MRAGAAVGIVAGLALTAATPGQATPTGTTLAGASMSADMTTVTGTELAHLTVTLHLTDAGGVDQQQGVIGTDASATCPCALVRTVTDSGVPEDFVSTQDQRAVVLTLVSGTAQDGMWAGSTTVGAAGSGHWQLTGVIAGTLRKPDNETPSWSQVDGSAFGPGVVISGSHFPVLTIATPTGLLPWPRHYLLTGQATYSDTGSPIPDLPLTVAPRFEDEWPLATVGTVEVTTDADGKWSLDTTAAAALSFVVFGAERVSSTEPGAGIQYSAKAQTARLCCRWDVSVATHRSGTLRYIDVRFSPGAKARLQLQRHTSSGWQPLIERIGPTAGVFHFNTHTPGLYRVRVMSPVYATYPALVTHTSPAIRV